MVTNVWCSAMTPVTTSYRCGETSCCDFTHGLVKMAEVVLSGVIISDDGAHNKVFIEEQIWRVNC